MVVTRILLIYRCIRFYTPLYLCTGKKLPTLFSLPPGIGFYATGVLSNRTINRSLYLYPFLASFLIFFSDPILYYRSSAVSVEMMGFHNGEPIHVDVKANRSKLFQNAHAADRSIQFIDLCGHEKYLKTTIFGLTGLLPDYCMVLVGSNMGLARITKEHIGIAAALGLPIMVVVTKIDLAPPDIHKATMDNVARVLKLARKMPYVVRSMENVDTVAKTILTDRITPIFRVSNVTGEGLNYLKRMLNILPSRFPQAVLTTNPGTDTKSNIGATVNPAPPGGAFSTPTKDSSSSSDNHELSHNNSIRQNLIDKLNDTVISTKPTAGSPGLSPVTNPNSTVAPLQLTPAPTLTNTTVLPIDPTTPGECIIDSVFNVPGVGTVVAGMVSRGCLRVGQTVVVGPDRTGEFIPCVVRSIHVHYTATDVALPGCSAAFAIRPKNKLKVVMDKKKTFVRKGMSLCDPALEPNSYWEFQAEILVLHHQTTLSVGYAPIIHIGCVVQAAHLTDIRSIDDNKPIVALRTGDRAIITCRFMYRPEYIHINDMLLFREGRAKGVGKLVAVTKPHHIGGVSLE